MTDGRYVKCADCSGYRIVASYSPIRVILADEDGFPILENNGTAIYTTYKLPNHVAAVPISKFDPSGLAPAACDHGVPEHPDPEINLHWKNKGAVSFIRSSLLDASWRCDQCRAERAGRPAIPPQIMSTPSGTKDLPREFADRRSDYGEYAP